MPQQNEDRHAPANIATAKRTDRVEGDRRVTFAAVRWELAVLGRRYRRIRRSERARANPRVALEQEDVVGGALAAAFALGIVVSGLVFVAVFGPLAWWAAHAAGLAEGASMLLVSLPPQLDETFFGPLFPRLSVPEARPVLYSLGLLYGVTSFTLVLVIMAGGLFRLAMTANALYSGFFLTRLIGIHVLARIIHQS